MHVFYCKEKRQLIISHNDTNRIFPIEKDKVIANPSERGTGKEVLDFRERFIWIYAIKYNDEFD